jgi:hypothetical protein
MSAHGSHLGWRVILCSSLNNVRNKMFANILSIFPSFHVLTDEKKFLSLFQCEEYDIVEVIVRGVSVSSQTVIKNSSFPEHIKIFSQFFIMTTTAPSICVIRSVIQSHKMR